MMESTESRRETLLAHKALLIFTLLPRLLLLLLFKEEVEVEEGTADVTSTTHAWTLPLKGIGTARRERETGKRCRIVAFAFSVSSRSPLCFLRFLFRFLVVHAIGRDHCAPHFLLWPTWNQLRASASRRRWFKSPIGTGWGHVTFPMGGAWTLLIQVLLSSCLDWSLSALTISLVSAVDDEAATQRDQSRSVAVHWWLTIGQQWSQNF